MKKKDYFLKFNKYRIKKKNITENRYYFVNDSCTAETMNKFFRCGNGKVLFM